MPIGEMTECVCACVCLSCNLHTSNAFIINLTGVCVRVDDARPYGFMGARSIQWNVKHSTIEAPSKPLVKRTPRTPLMWYQTYILSTFTLTKC